MISHSSDFVLAGQAHINGLWIGALKERRINNTMETKANLCQVIRKVDEGQPSVN